MVKAAAKAAAPRVERVWLISAKQKPSDLGGFLALLQMTGASVAPKSQLNLGGVEAVAFRGTVWIDLYRLKRLNCFRLHAGHDGLKRETMHVRTNMSDCRLGADGRSSQ